MEAIILVGGLAATLLLSVIADIITSNKDH